MGRRVILTILIATIAGIVIGTILVQGGLTCEEWQDRYADASKEAEGGVFAFVNEGPLAERLRELEKQRPEGCPKPEAR